MCFIIPLLSVVIPTHNRSQYMFSCIQSLIKIEGNMEIIISDSSTDLKLKNLLEGDLNYLLNDARLKYYHTTDELDMTANLNRAISFSTGHYVVCIGDDDTVIPDVLSYLELFKEKDIDIIAPDVVINYAWPDFSTKYFKNGHKSNLYIDYNEPYCIQVKTGDALKVAINNCFQGTEGLPKLYHGFVSRKTLLKVKRLTGEFLHGSTPDMSASIALCYVSESFYRCNFPLTIPGASGMSNTGRAANNRHVGLLKDEKQTENILDSSWIRGIPKYFSVEVVWAQSGLETARKFDNQICSKFPFLKLIALCTIKHPVFLIKNMEALRAIEIKSVKKVLKYMGNVIIFSFLIYSRLLKRALNPTAANGRCHIKGIENICEAQNTYRDRVIHKENFSTKNNLLIINCIYNID